VQDRLALGLVEARQGVPRRRDGDPSMLPAADGDARSSTEPSGVQAAVIDPGVDTY
jgi:hypothetical protein